MNEETGVVAIFTFNFLLIWTAFFTIGLKSLSDFICLSLFFLLIMRVLSYSLEVLYELRLANDSILTLLFT